MRKLLPLTMLLTIISVTTIFGEPTKRRALTEFCEQSTKRLIYSCEIMGIDSNDILTRMPSTPYQALDVLMLGTSVGSLWVNPDDLTISEASFTYFTQTESDEETMISQQKFIAGISALEFSAWDEYMLKVEEQITGEQKDIVLETTDFLTESLLPALDADAINKLLSDVGSEIFLCSKNYDYYAFSCSYEVDGAEYTEVCLAARARNE